MFPFVAAFQFILVAIFVIFSTIGRGIGNLISVFRKKDASS